MTPRPKVLITRRWPAAVEARLRERYDVHLNADDRPLTRDALRLAMTNFDAICPTVTDRFDTDILRASGSSVRILANFGVGVDHIDLDAARAAGIAVSNTPDVLTEATAELEILLMLMASRRAGEGERLLRAGDWQGLGPTYFLGQGLADKLLCLVGFGRIARATAHMARAAFGMRIAYYSRRRAEIAEEAALEAVHYGSLEAMAGDADILSLHCPGGAETRHLVNAALIARMKPSAILVNTARGSVVDEDALAAALGARLIASAGLDVFEREPAVTPALIALPNVVLLPHMGSATVEARTAMGMRAADNIDLFFDGAELRDRVG